MTEPTQFRKRPVVIDAVQLQRNNVDRIAEWCGGNAPLHGYYILIPTLEGEMRANLGDWVVRGIKGEFYPVKPDIFEATYEPAATNDATHEAADEAQGMNYRMQELALGACIIDGLTFGEVTKDFYQNAAIVGNALLHAGQKLGAIPKG